MIVLRSVGGDTTGKSKLYWESLYHQGFQPRHELYRYFAQDIFHDGEVSVREVDLESRRVSLMLRNVSAVNVVVATKKDVKVKLKDFVTKIEFFGVRKCNINYAAFNS